MNLLYEDEDPGAAFKSMYMFEGRDYTEDRLALQRYLEERNIGQCMAGGRPARKSAYKSKPTAKLEPPPTNSKKASDSDDVDDEYKQDEDDDYNQDDEDDDVDYEESFKKPSQAKWKKSNENNMREWPVKFKKEFEENTKENEEPKFVELKEFKEDIKVIEEPPKSESQLWLCDENNKEKPSELKKEPKKDNKENDGPKSADEKPEIEWL